MWQPIVKDESIPCACPHDCGHRFVKVSLMSFPGTQELHVSKKLDDDHDRTYVITYLPEDVRLCREVPDTPNEEIAAAMKATLASLAYAAPEMQMTVLWEKLVRPLVRRAERAEAQP